MTIAFDRRLFLAGSLGAMTACGLSAAARAAGPTWPLVDAALRPFVDGSELSGYVTLAMHRGRLAHASAYGQRNLETGAPMTMDTLFRIFSMTKPVTAAAMMILRDEGRWRPEDPIAKYLPELADLKCYRGQGADGRPILEAPRFPPTMAQLMTHTAGFSYGGGADYVDAAYRAKPPTDATSSQDFLERVAALPLAYEPGAEWRYSISVDLQGVIIERLTGRRLSAFMAERIFEPLGMRDTGFVLPAAERFRLASIYTRRDGKLVPYPIPMGKEDYATPPAFESGGGGLLSTASDYARFASMLLARGKGHRTRILSRAAVDEMLSNHLAPALAARGFGGFQRIRPGYEFGYNGVVVTDPARAGVALGRGSYLWDGAAGTWFWVDPENEVLFVGLIQRPAWLQLPPVQALSQKAVLEAVRGGQRD